MTMNLLTADDWMVGDRYSPVSTHHAALIERLTRTSMEELV
ncbi:MAG: hypothetical protein WAV07_09500 [Candidatus Contendobacter sp.]